MWNSELRKLLLEVISSWQVIVVTVVLVLYVFLVKYVSRVYHRPPRRPAPKPKASYSPAGEKTALAPEADELGLEEENSAKK